MVNSIQTRKIIISAVALGVLFLGGVIVGRSLNTVSFALNIDNVRETSEEYKFVEPLLYIKVPEEGVFSEYAHLKKAISSFASKVENDRRADSVSMYVRNLNTSQWIGVNTDNKYAPSSMLKVVTLVAVLREVEEKPALLQSRVTLVPPKNAVPEKQDTYLPRDPILPGGTYTIQELIEHMIIESDNVANRALSSFVGEDKLRKVYDDLQLPWPGLVPFPGYTTQEYSRLFRTIYNATYLSARESELALELLSRTAFTQGIAAGVPEGTVVSHKFGVHFSSEGSGVERELHDCGIVYYPEHPYFLCVMTRGVDYKKLEGVLKDASALVWEEMRKVH